MRDRDVLDEERIPGSERAVHVRWSAALAFVAIAFFAAGLWVGARLDDQPASEASPQEARIERQTRLVVTPQPPPLDLSGVEVPPPFEEYEIPEIAGARIALVIDDLGRSVQDLEILGSLGVPMTYSVLPFEDRTGEVVAEIGRRGWELMCHLPMEPQSRADPGPGALTADMTPQQLAVATREALDAIPGAVGINNHMGSSLSANVDAMRPVLEVVDERGLFFLDSRTSASSVGYQLALAAGIPAAERQVFLDPVLEVEAIDEQFDRLLWLAQDRGEAVAIGHPHALTLEVLARRIPEAIEAGFEFVPVSYLLDRSAPPL